MDAAIPVLFLALFSTCTALQCVDHNNNPVDWYFLYKLPIISKHHNPIVKYGIGYAFISSNGPKNWTLSTLAVNDTKSIVGLTLEPLYESNDLSTWHILYNDEPPDANTNSKKGHTKGVVVGNDNEGFWLIHSVPKFPPLPNEGYSYPHTGTEFGQSFLCISLNIDNLDVVGELLQYNEPDIYSETVPLMYKATHPNIYKASIGITNQTSPGFEIKSLTSKNRLAFTAFAKNRYFGEDLYSDLVSPHLKDTLLVETWPNGPGRLPSNCSLSNGAENVEQINFEFLAPKTNFKSTHDHSKWAVAPNSKYVCIGDINRAVSQKKRGGGTVCLQNEDLATNYKNIVTQVENCIKN